MRVIPWSVELLLGTPGRGFQAHTHISITFSRVQIRAHNTADHRRSHSTSHPHGRLQAAPTPVASASGNTGGNGYEKAFGFGRHVQHRSTSPDNPDVSTDADSYRTALNFLLAALRQGDTLKLYFCLLALTRGASLDNQSFRGAVQSIPPTTFSEILRHFDPFHVSNHIDSAPGIAITWGAAIHSPLGDLINKWGVKVLYVRILSRLRLLQRARQLPRADGSPSQIRPLLHDYVVLLRCAGATSNIQVAKAIWYRLLADGYSDWTHAKLFAEFVKARYLTEALYANNDLARLRLRPLDMHRISVTLKGDVVRKLKRMHASIIERSSHRFGYNVNEHYFAEHLTRSLRQRTALRKLEARATRRLMIPGDESLLCAILKAHGRHGSLYESNVLMRFWGINISIYKTELGNREISGGHDFPPGSAQAPTKALLDAVVHCYGNMGEILLAKALVDFISRRWSIAVPDKVWSDLLDFARIISTDPAAREWRIAQFKHKLTTPEMVLDIWKFSTQEPHNFQPGMKDYHSLLRSMISPQQDLSQFLEAFRQLTPLYNYAARQLQVAWAELLLTTQQRVPNHAAYRRYRVAQSNKHYMWYCFHYTARQAFKKSNAICIDDVDAVRNIPHLVAEAGPFLGTQIEYHIATGVVVLSLDYSPLRTVQTEQTLEALPHSDRPSGRTKGTGPVGMDRETSEKLMSDAALSATPRIHTKTTGISPGEGTQLAKDEYVLEQEDKDGDEDEDALDEKGHREEMDDRTTRPSGHVRTPFDEYYKPEHEPLAAQDLERAPEEESALSEDSFLAAFATQHRDEVDTSSTSHYSKDWNSDATADALEISRRRSSSQQIVERPAYLWRPPYTAPPGKPSLSALREDGKEFTGYHEDPRRVRFAAHRIVRKLAHAPGVPVSLGEPGISADKRQLVGHLMWLRT